jgi:hypothetical protein
VGDLVCAPASASSPGIGLEGDGSGTYSATATKLLVAQQLIDAARQELKSEPVAQLEAQCSQLQQENEHLRGRLAAVRRVLEET